LQNQGITGIILDEALTCVQFVTGLLRGPAMPIDPSLEDGVFEPEATAAMGEAFEAACKELQDGGEPEVRKLIAKRIIAAARRGELDPVRLRTAVLSWIVVTPNVVRGFALSGL
jgi:hypothetical protein